MALISYFHEPWGDEAQSWAIAKYASYKDMLFSIGHAEGHPSLWWIYLSIFAKAGLPFEAGLKIASILLNSIFAWLIIFKVQISRLLRFSIPFTYFFFYQYGVISRCYSILLIAMVLLSIVWNKRSISPFKVSFSLILLCLSSAYGIAIAFSLALLWTIELTASIIREKKIVSTDKFQILALFLLLISALIIVALLFPTNNPYALRAEKNNSYLFRLFYMFFLEPIDSLFYMSVYIDTELFKYHPDILSIIIGVFISVIFYVIIFSWPKARGFRRYLIIPHSIFSIISASSYFWSHHIGITTALFLFWFIICVNSNNTNDLYFIIPHKKESVNSKAMFKVNNSEIETLIRSYWLVPTFIIIVSISWSIESSILDIQKNYSANRAIYNLLSNNKLDKLSILPNDLSSWTSYLGDNNNVYKLHVNQADYSYIINNLSRDDYDNYYNYLAIEYGYPDIYIGSSNTSFLNTLPQYNPLLPLPPSYVELCNIESGSIFKGEYSGVSGWTDVTAYIKKDIYMKIDNLSK